METILLKDGLGERSLEKTPGVRRRRGRDCEPSVPVRFTIEGVVACESLEFQERCR